MLLFYLRQRSSSSWYRRSMITPAPIHHWSVRRENHARARELFALGFALVCKRSDNRQHPVDRHQDIIGHEHATDRRPESSVVQRLRYGQTTDRSAEQIQDYQDVNDGTAGQTKITNTITITVCGRVFYSLRVLVRIIMLLYVFAARKKARN